MGACNFYCSATGKTASEAFSYAVEKAQYDFGHAGYTGSIAEKDSFVSIPLPEGEDPLRYADQLLDAGDPRIDDKWGPAGCIKTGEKRDGEDVFLFFGWASE